MQTLASLNEKYDGYEGAIVALDAEFDRNVERVSAIARELIEFANGKRAPDRVKAEDLLAEQNRIAGRLDDINVERADLVGFCDAIYAEIKNVRAAEASADAGPLHPPTA